MELAIARVSYWLTKRAETPCIPSGLVVDERVANLSTAVLMSAGSISSRR